MDLYNEKAKQRLLSKIKLIGNCWIFTGCVNPKGYGLISYKNKTFLSHRLAYILFNGDLDSNLTIDHLCRKRDCINPDHLEAVTQKENIHRSPFTINSINARKTHCPQGHEYTPENTYIVNNSISRQCKICTKTFVKNSRLKLRKKHYEEKTKCKN